MWGDSWWRLGEVCEVPRSCLLWRGLRCHGHMYSVSCIFFSKFIFHITWLHISGQISYVCLYTYMSDSFLTASSWTDFTLLLSTPFYVCDLNLAFFTVVPLWCRQQCCLLLSPSTPWHFSLGEVVHSVQTDCLCPSLLSSGDLVNLSFFFV